MNDVRLLSVRGNQLAERVVDVIPQVLDRLENIKEKKKKQRIDVKPRIRVNKKIERIRHTHRVNKMLPTVAIKGLYTLIF